MLFIYKGTKALGVSFERLAMWCKRNCQVSKTCIYIILYINARTHIHNIICVCITFICMTIVIYLGNLLVTRELLLMSSRIS